MFTVCRLISSYQLEKHIKKYLNLVNGKDLEQVVAVGEFGIKYLVSYDKHFEGLDEYKIPRQFAELLGLRAYLVDYRNWFEHKALVINKTT